MDKYGLQGPHSGGYISKDAVNTLKEIIKPGVPLKEGVVTGVYPFLFTVKPFGSKSNKLDSYTWTEYFQKAYGKNNIERAGVGGKIKERYSV